jgi:hypothetical protein
MLSDERFAVIKECARTGEAPKDFEWRVQELIDEIDMLRQENTLLVTKVEQLEERG